jgi:uncharacterized protein YcnI
MGKKMKSKPFLVAAIMLTPILAFARTKDSANVDLNQPVEVAGAQLPSGQYKVTWEGTGPNITVNFTKDKKTIASAPAKLVGNSMDEQAVETTTAADHTTVLQAIDLKNITLQFKNDAPAAGN